MDTSLAPSPEKISAGTSTFSRFEVMAIPVSDDRKTA